MVLQELVEAFSNVLDLGVVLGDEVVSVIKFGLCDLDLLCKGLDGCEKWDRLWRWCRRWWVLLEKGHNGRW